MDTLSLTDEELFARAAEMADESQRQQLLDRACAGQQERRRLIEALLKSSRQADAFFEHTQARVQDSTERELTFMLPHLIGPTALGATPLVSRIGRYRLLEKIGEGGCGVVYTAEQQEPVRRRVALKIIKLGMETRSVIARFEAERQALAMMDHPNIARVFDAGATDRGSPYFVMELVDGVKITDYCDQHRLSLNQRLDLFITLCHAIQHAHHKGVVHGDVKPSNILVTTQDGSPLPKVIDFGISKATEIHLVDRALFTAYTQFVGTPTYMSPEQAQMGGMDIDTRSDIYSLGVLLYELLTGHTPFDSKALLSSGIDEMRRILREKEPPSPSARLRALPKEEQRRIADLRRTDVVELQRALQGDMDWILTKALEKDRRRRYETANGLAMDVRRHLDHEPVLARPPSLTYRMGKTFRRNRVAFVATAAVLTSLVIGTTVSTWLFLKERQMRQRAVAAEQQQARLRFDAENREKMTQAALLISQDRYEQADALLASITLDRATVEGTAVLRALGEWHATHGRWLQATAHFRKLVEFDAIDGMDTATLDLLRLGPALYYSADTKAFQSFRTEILTRYSANAPFGDRVLRVCLLRPAGADVLAPLQPTARAIQETIPRDEAAGDTFRASWQSLALALWAYRNGAPDEAVAWARRCLGYPGLNVPRAASARLLVHLGLRRRGSSPEAEAQLALARELVQGMPSAKGERGSPVQGFWFDRAFAEILLAEAEAGESARR